MNEPDSNTLGGKLEFPVTNYSRGGAELVRGDAEFDHRRRARLPIITNPVMKIEIDRPDKLPAWLASPRPAVFQGQDLVAHSTAIAERDLRGCVFLGCPMGEPLAAAAVAAGCLVLPRVEGLAFDPYRPCLYTPAELYDRFDPDRPASQQECLDWRVWGSYMDPAERRERPAGLDTMLMRRLHDASIHDALDDLLDEVIGEEAGRPVTRRLKAVAVMGGHDESRSPSGPYAEVARMALSLAQAGHLVVTGGGPGLMEAANLGAYLAGFPEPEAALARTLETLVAAPKYSDPEWLARGFAAWKALGTPAHPERGRNLGLPTWFYGHEPPNVFATDIAKYFENSLREEGLLALALAGVVFARGNAGTVQEIFQDACQNYYRTYRRTKSPMILLGRDYWNPASAWAPGADPAAAAGSPDRRKPVYPLLEKLAAEKGFADYLLLTDDCADVLSFLETHRPVEG
jgi:predicted Rossmann-fold nucleotide-binding protein